MVPMGLPIGRWFRLVNVNSGHGLSVEDRSLNEGARLIQQDVDATEGGLLWRLIPAAEAGTFCKIKPPSKSCRCQITERMPEPTLFKPLLTMIASISSGARYG
jgi:hypothetical protein